MELEGNLEDLDKVSIQEDAQNFLISWRLYSSKARSLGCFCLIWNAFLIVWFAVVFSFPDEVPWLFIVFPIAHVAAGIAMLFQVLALYFNHSRFQIRSGVLTIYKGPISFFGTKTFEVANIAAVLYEEGSSSFVIQNKIGEALSVNGDGSITRISFTYYKIMKYLEEYYHFKNQSVSSYQTSNLQIEQHQNELTITQHWYSSSVMMLVFFTIGWNSFVVFMYQNIFSDGINVGTIIFGVFLSIFLFVGIFLIYLCLVARVNKTKIHLGNGQLSFSHYPLLWTRGQSFPLEMITGAEVFEKNNSFTVRATFQGGRRPKDITSSFLDAAMAETIANKINEFLGTLPRSEK